MQMILTPRIKAPHDLYILTTDHPASSYGNPVLVDPTGNAYGRNDRVPNTGGRDEGTTASQLVILSTYDELVPELYRRFTGLVVR